MRKAALAALLLLPVAALPAAAQSGAAPVPRPASRTAPSGPLAEARTAYVPFENTPFPYRGMIPKENKPFLDAASGSRRGHTSPRGGVLWEDQTYSDRNVLIHMPAGFDPRRPAALVVFFHGNKATLARDVVARQGVPRQLDASGINAVLVAPQFARDVPDSSSGSFWEPGRFNAFLREASRRAADLYGVPGLRANFDRMPVILIAYSGGYQAAAYAAAIGGAGSRLQGLVLLDAVYAEEDKFAAWIAGRPRRAFFFSAYTISSRPNNALLQKLLTQKRVAFRTSPAPGFAQGGVTFLDAGSDLVHDDFVTRAWVDDPITWVLSKIPGFQRKPAR
jgi:hypothetical protein